MLAGAYVYYYVLSIRDPRFKYINRQPVVFHESWSRTRALTVLGIGAAVAFSMSHLLMADLEGVTNVFHVPPQFLGFIVLPALGNIPERWVAITAARSGQTNLSLAICLGAAAQVGMVIAPTAVLFGWLSGNQVTLLFASLPLSAMALCLIAGFLVLQDGKWNINEGVMLLALFFAFSVCFAFSAVQP
jgi:Ca2+:H+ antiporter